MLAHDRSGSDGAPPAVLLHGWPGDRGDWRAVAERLPGHDVVVPDLAGFGESLAEARDLPGDGGLDAQVGQVAALLDALGLSQAVVAGYDVGSRVAQGLARTRPDLVARLVLSPPLPGAGARVLEPDAVTEFWYQSFHQLGLAEGLLDGRRCAVRAYLEHFWTHWSGPAFTPSAAELDRLAGLYARPGAFVASLSWYRAGSGTVRQAQAETPPAADDRLPQPTLVLWPEHDPLFPPAWGDRVGEWFADVELRILDCGHFSPVEAPDALADAIDGG